MMQSQALCPSLALALARTRRTPCTLTRQRVTRAAAGRAAARGRRAPEFLQWSEEGGARREMPADRAARRDDAEEAGEAFSRLGEEEQEEEEEEWATAGSGGEVGVGAESFESPWRGWDDARPSAPSAEDGPFSEEEEEAFDERGGASSSGRPDVTPLSRVEQQSLLSVSATGPQYAYYWGAFDVALQRVFASLLGCLVTANAVPLVAVPAGLYFLWAPVALAARRNAPLRRYPCAGIWHARVLSAEAVTARAPGGIVFDAMGDAFLPRRRTGAVMRVLVGDASGARLQLEVPLAPEHRDIQRGDEAELLVLSDEPRLERFRAVREAYLPELGVWLSEYPFLERRTYRTVSDAIAAERERERDA